LIDRLQRDGAAMALCDADGAHTWNQFVWAGLGWRDCFIKCGLAPGSHAAVLLDNRLDYFEILFGAVLAGVWLTPLNRHLTRAELDYILTDPGG
jgi:acyl-CoA synthetase (AMP-forming)/AMP-acid ligase II